MSASLVVICLLLIALAVVIAYIVERDYQVAHPHMAAPGMLFFVIISFGVAASAAVALIGGLMEVLA